MAVVAGSRAEGAAFKGLFAVSAVLLVLAVPPSSASGLRFAGPFLAYADKFYPCDDGESTNRALLHVRVSKFNVKKPHLLQTMSGNASLVGIKGGASDDMWGRVRMDTRSNMKWVQNAFIFNFPNKACSNLRTHIPDLFHVVFQRDPSSREECTLPPKIYTFQNEPVNWTFPKFPSMPYGFWRFHISFGVGREAYFCHNIECHSFPKN